MNHPSISVMLNATVVTLMVALIHACATFLLYRHALSCPNYLANGWTVILVLPLLAFAAYSLSLLSTEVLRASRWRIPVLVGLSLIAMFASTCIGLVVAINEYGI